MPPSLYLEGDDLNDRLLEYFTTVYEKYESLFEVLSCDEAYFKKPIPLRHPLIFYYGHTATFFINKMVIAGIVKRVDPFLESICAVGVDEMSWDDLNDHNYSWPSVQAVTEYRQKVKQVVCDVIRSHPTHHITWEHPLWSVVMGIEHELIHLETSSVLIRQHDIKYVKNHPLWSFKHLESAAIPSTLVTIPEGEVCFERKHNEPWYGWDNEYGHHSDHIPTFKAESMLVSNSEFLDFIRDGGYEKHHYWSDEGWKWRTFSAAGHPTFWIPSQEGYALRMMCEIIPFHPSLPVETNFHEAQAFCAWKREKTGLAYRLPTEDEHQRIVEHTDYKDHRSSHPTPTCDHLCHSSCVPVDTYAHGELFDVMGNVWQWTQTPIYPFDGFKTHPYYDDFTAPTFDGRHNIIAGSSWISCGNETLTSSRYAFRRHFFQHAGFRPIVSALPPKISPIHYENDPLLTRIIHSNFSDGVNKSYYERIVHTITSFGKSSKMLILGCESGVLPFMLAPFCDHIDGVEPSARILDIAVELQEGQTVHYTLPDEGELVTYHETRLDEKLLANGTKISFIQADPSNLKPILDGYDFVVIHAILERIYAPKMLLKTLSSRLKAGGKLIVITSSLHDTTLTPPHERLGGYKKDGETFTAIQAIKEALSGDFEELPHGDTLYRLLVQNTHLAHHIKYDLLCWKKR